MKEEERQIIEQLKLGHEKAYHYLFENHYSILCKVAFSILKDTFLAEDIVGNVIVNLWEKREDITITISLRAYLARSVRNRCINYLKQEYVQKELRFSTSKKINAFDYDFWIDDSYPLTTLLDEELENEIAQSINRLPKECKEVFRLSRFENMKNQDIADVLNISINTVKYHLKNALAKLSKDLGKYLRTLIVLLCTLK
jgi:RNA polymerase sigma-70 factor (ECF subfamily)